MAKLGDWRATRAFWARLQVFSADAYRVGQESSGDISRTIPFFSNPLNYFLGKHVLVEAENLTVDGRLIRHQLPNGRNEKPHRPFILILETPIGKVLIRGNRTTIKEGVNKTQTR
jgi:hypothetical protein